MGGGIDQRALIVLAMNFDQRASELLSTCTLTGWSLTNARVRPSANCTRRRISSSSAGMSSAASSARAGWSRATSNTAVTWPCSTPCRTSALIAAAPKGQRESIEQDRLAGAGFAGEHGKAGRQNRYRAGRSTRCRGSRVGRAWRLHCPGIVSPAARRASTPYRFCIIKDADGRHKPGRDRVG